MQGAPQPALQPVSITSLGEYVHEQQQQQQQLQLQQLLQQELTPKDLQLPRPAAKTDAPWGAAARGVVRVQQRTLNAVPTTTELQGARRGEGAAARDAALHDAAHAALHAQVL